MFVTADVFAGPASQADIVIANLTGAMLGFVLLGQLLGSNRTGLALGVIAGALLQHRQPPRFE